MCCSVFHVYFYLYLCHLLLGDHSLHTDWVVLVDVQVVDVNLPRSEYSTYTS